MRFANALGGGAWVALAVCALVLCFGPIGPLDNLRFPLLAATMLYAAASVAHRSAWRKNDVEEILNSRFFPGILCGLAALAFVRIKLLQLPAGQISGVDFSHIDYALWSTTQGRFMEIPIIPRQATFTDFFGNHYSPILFFHVAARWLFDSPLSSLVVHALSLAAAVPVLHSLAKRILDRASASLLCLAYVFCGAVASTLQFDMHQESFYPLALGLVFLGLYSRSAYLWIGTLLALSIKEDAGVYLFPIFLGLAYLFPVRRRQCLALSLIAGAATVLALKVLMPMHQPAAAAVPYYMPMWAKYGASFKEVAWGMLSHPHLVAWDVIGNKDLYKSLLPWGFLPLLTPAGLLALPPVVVSSTAIGVQKSFGLYYGIVLVPIFFFASAYALRKFTRWRRRILLAVVATSAFVGGSYLHFHRPLPYLAEIERGAQEVSNLRVNGKIYVQSGLLPFLPYGLSWQRIDGLSQIPPAGEAVVVLFDGLSQGSLDVDAVQMPAELNRLGYGSPQNFGRLKVYR